MTSLDETLKSFRPEQVESFRYVGYDFDPQTHVLCCRYALDDLEFEEQITFQNVSIDPSTFANADAAFSLIFLLAGVSYYKAAAPPIIRVETGGLTPGERRLLEAVYLDGLGEYAFRNELDLSNLTIVADERPVVTPVAPTSTNRPLIPFGGGLDSIITVEGIRDRTTDAALFVVSKEGDLFDAIETAAAVTGLPVVRAERKLDPLILRSRELGFRNGHVPVTGIISAIAVAAAILDGRDAVAMSNEWSASSGNVIRAGRTVNHQWSKTLEFEELFRTALSEVLPVSVNYFSWLRPFSELWVADRFSRLDDYWLAFRSCNRAFHIDRAHRLDRWCGTCDKCCFIDLILSPFMAEADLRAIFGGTEPLANPDLLEAFRTLLGLSGDIKPFECVGDVNECRAAAAVAAGRDDRKQFPLLHTLAEELRATAGDDSLTAFTELQRPLGQHRIPDEYAPSDLLD